MNRTIRACIYVFVALLLLNRVTAVGSNQDSNGGGLVFGRFDDDSYQIGYIDLNNYQIRYYDLGLVRPSVYAVLPVGTHIAFADADGNIIILNLATGNSTMLGVQLNMDIGLIYDHNFIKKKGLNTP